MGLELGNNKGNEPGFWDGKVLGTTLLDIDILSLGTDYCTELGFTVGTSDVKFEVLLLGDSLGYLDGLEVGCTEGTELWLSGGRVLVKTLGKYYGKELGLS